MRLWPTTGTLGWQDVEHVQQVPMPQCGGDDAPGVMPHGDGHVKDRHGTDHPTCVDGAEV
jgi:hypothetical protein